MIARAIGSHKTGIVKCVKPVNPAIDLAERRMTARAKNHPGQAQEVSPAVESALMTSPSGRKRGPCGPLTSPLISLAVSKFLFHELNLFQKVIIKVVETPFTASLHGHEITC